MFVPLTWSRLARYSCNVLRQLVNAFKGCKSCWNFQQALNSVGGRNLRSVVEFIEAMPEMFESSPLGEHTVHCKVCNKDINCFHAEGADVARRHALKHVTTEEKLVCKGCTVDNSTMNPSLTIHKLAWSFQRVAQFIPPNPMRVITTSPRFFITPQSRFATTATCIF